MVGGVNVVVVFVEAMLLLLLLVVVVAVVVLAVDIVVGWGRMAVMDIVVLGVGVDKVVDENDCSDSI